MEFQRFFIVFFFFFCFLIRLKGKTNVYLVSTPRGAPIDCTKLMGDYIEDMIKAFFYVFFLGGGGGRTHWLLALVI